MYEVVDLRRKLLGGSANSNCLLRVRDTYKICQIRGRVDIQPDAEGNGSSFNGQAFDKWANTISLPALKDERRVQGQRTIEQGTRAAQGSNHR